MTIQHTVAQVNNYHGLLSRQPADGGSAKSVIMLPDHYIVMAVVIAKHVFISMFNTVEFLGAF